MFKITLQKSAENKVDKSTKKGILKTPTKGVEGFIFEKFEGIEYPV